MELLTDGTLGARTEVKYRPGPEQKSVVGVRFTMEDFDEIRAFHSGAGDGA